MKPATQVLIERYQKHLYAIAFNICRNQQDAEDVVQDTFIQYHTYKKEFDTVMKLPEKYRIVLHLFYYEDYTTQEISDILHLSVNNVKTRLARGRALLKETLKEEWNDDE